MENKMKILPCPFCGYDADVTPRPSYGFYVRCSRFSKCAAEGPFANNKKDAIIAWNTRTNQWQPIEKVPKDGTVVDLWAGGMRLTSCVWNSLQKCWLEGWIDDEGEHCPVAVLSDCHPTHWMPIPDPPKE
jgi:Lar family restriction alleviation protein